MNATKEKKWVNNINQKSLKRRIDAYNEAEKELHKELFNDRCNHVQKMAVALNKLYNEHLRPQGTSQLNQAAPVVVARASSVFLCVEFPEEPLDCSDEEILT